MPDAFSYSSLVQRLFDLERLTRRPPAGERAGLASSYDRASSYDAANDRYVAWDANADGTGVVRMEGENAVLADLKGPGCIWRIWSATVGDGRVKIYLDDAGEPAVDLPFAGLFDGKHEPFNRPHLVYTTTALGYNNYTPICFQKSCRIVAEPNWGKYYHFNYTIFPEGTRVPTFSRRLSVHEAAALDAANAALANAGERPKGSTETVSADFTLAPRQSRIVAELKGAGVITALRMKIDLPPDEEAQRRRLRELALNITWDDDTQPAVWSPLGDFFGSSAGAVPFRTLPVGLHEDGTWYCHWQMPFASRASIRIENASDADIAMVWEIDHRPTTRPVSEYLRFHAKWHRDVLPVRADRHPDWTLLQTKGIGRFVGTQLHVWNPRGGWWGEGDEKFFVDGERFPSVFGTGTEDYLGYAWSSGNTFVQALHSQPVNQNNRGHVSANRWHVPDDVPFQTSFEGAIEKYFPNDNPCHWAAVAYWYLAPGGVDPFGPVPVEQRIGPWTWPEIWRANGVLEAEELPVVKEQWKHAGGSMDAVARGIGPGVLSNDRFLIWWVDQPGLRLELGGIRVERTGKYRIAARFVRDHEMGCIQFDLDGRKLGAPVDLFAPTKGRAPLTDEPVVLGELALTEGEHIFGCEVAGKHPDSSGYLMAIDYLRIDRIE